MTLGSLFAGIGGFDLGFERAGFETVWQVEIDEYCRRVLERHFPRAERFGDIRECGIHNLRCVDVITGGFPCQPFSCAGERKGEADNRHLWPEMFRVISELRPSYVVAENVRFFSVLEHGRYLDQVYDDMESIGYETIPPIVIPACALGAGHRRDRLWVIAHTDSKRQRRIQSESGEKSKEALGPERAGETRIIANSYGKRKLQPQRCQQDIGRWTGHSDWWATHANLLSLDDGVSATLDEIRGFGNAVVPQIAQWIAERIKAVNFIPA